MNRPLVGYYRLKSGHGILCFRILSVSHISYEKKYYKLKVDWWTELTGASWGNQYGLPRNWKMSWENLESFERFYPVWIRS